MRVHLTYISLLAHVHKGLCRQLFGPLCAAQNVRPCGLYVHTVLSAIGCRCQRKEVSLTWTPGEFDLSPAVSLIELGLASSLDGSQLDVGFSSFSFTYKHGQELNQNTSGVRVIWMITGGAFVCFSLSASVSDRLILHKTSLLYVHWPVNRKMTTWLWLERLGKVICAQMKTTVAVTVHLHR